jgi:hypothetical protein
MITQRRSTGNRLADSTSRLAVKKIPSRQFPVQRKIRNLEDELNAFNERITELENEGHRGYAMDVLKANAIDLARQIDELRCLIVVPTKKGEPS